MPRLTRWYIRFSLAYLVAALAAGVWQAAGGPAWLTPIYVHLLVVGWITGMIFGVAYWMFPKLSKDQPRGTTWLGIATFALLNVGLLLRLAGESLDVGPLLVGSALCQWLAGVGFIATTWPRVKER